MFHNFCFMLICSVQITTPTQGVFKYRFQDSSVPPPHHRSYEIIVKPGQVSFVVDSYGDILLSDKTEIDQDRYNEFVKSLKKIKPVMLKEANDSKGCTGGTTDIVDLHFEGDDVIKGSIYHCGGNNYGSIRGDMGKIKELFRSMVPDIGKKMLSVK